MNRDTREVGYYACLTLARRQATERPLRRERGTSSSHSAASRTVIQTAGKRCSRAVNSLRRLPYSTAFPAQPLVHTGLQSKLPLSRETREWRKARSTSERHKEHREELQGGIKLRQNTKLNTRENCAMARAASYTVTQMEGWCYLLWTG